MLNTIVQILPLIIIFAVGYLLKKVKFLTSEDGSTLLKLIFYAGAPALTFTAVTNVKIEASLIWLCFLPIVMVFTMMLVTMIVRRSLLSEVNRKTFGSLAVGVLIMNTGFLIPFVERIFGVEGLARFAIIDAVGGMMTFSVVYATAVKYSGDKIDNSYIIQKLLISPPLWALIIALTLRLLSVTPPTVAMDTMGILARFVSPIVLLALGLKFTLKIKDAKLLAYPLVLRFIVGGLIGLAFIKLTGIDGLTAKIAFFASIAPIGFNSITFADLENLDTEFAASQVSLAILIALILAPFTVQLLSHL